jgi:FAD/FMN-containing dehydrogenase
MFSLTDERFDRRGLLERAGWLAVSAGALPVVVRRGEAPDLAALQRRIAGTVVARGTAGYDAARLLYSPRFDGTHPLAVVYCESATDVSRTILWARQSKVPVAARSGGHSYAGYSTTPGVVIDVSRLASITVNPASATAGIGAGARLMDVYRKLAARGVTIPAGSCPSVGIAGLALGGGVGFAARKLGLTCDNLRSFTMVTADGVVRQCNPQRNPDLFWACRGGGGGNFGIATRFTFTTHPVSTVTIFRAGWSWSDAARVVDAWQRWAPNAPDELFSLLALEARDSGEALIGSSGQFFGTSSQLQALLASFFAAGATPVSLEVRTMPYLDAMLLWAGCSNALHCTLGDGVGRSTYAAKSDYAATPLSGPGIATLLRAIEARAAAPARASVLLDAYGGAINRVPKAATAFVHRDALFSFQYIAGWDPAGGHPAASAAASWLRTTHTAMRPHVSGQAYQNYIDAELPRWGLAYYGSNYARLRRVKRRYDPRNVFRFAQSIVPAPG